MKTIDIKLMGLNEKEEFLKLNQDVKNETYSKMMKILEAQL